METQEILKALRSLHQTLDKKLSNIKVTQRPAVTREGERVEVHVKIIFLRVGDIDTVKEVFDADVFIRVKWREPEWDNQELPGEDYDWKKHWSPDIFIQNNHAEPKEEIWYGAKRDGQNKAWAFEKRRVKGTFAETMELHQFPFDTQHLTIRLSSRRNPDEVTMVADVSSVSAVRVQSFIDAQEWALHNQVTTWSQSGMSLVDRNHRHPTFSAACTVQRRIGFFVWNIFVVLLLITGLAFTSFAIENKLTPNRLLLTFTALLTSVAFKHIANRNVPQISYLTFLDKYILASMALLTVAAAWHAVLSLLLYDENLAATADTYALAVLGAVYVIFQASFFIHAYVEGRKSRDWHLKHASQKEMRATGQSNKEDYRH